MGDLIKIQETAEPLSYEAFSDRPAVYIDPAAVVGVRIEAGASVRVVLLLPGHEVQLPAHPDGIGSDLFETEEDAMRAVRLLLAERFGKRTYEWLSARAELR
jgi:hypothetical protein